jgi:uncharacterized membrane protein YvlD (DUF360 family)
MSEPRGDSDWRPARLRLSVPRVLVAWVIGGLSVYVAAALVPGVGLEHEGGAALVAAVIAAFNAVVPPIVAALRLPWTFLAGFLLVLVVDALALTAAADLVPNYIRVDSFAAALATALVVSAVTIVLQVMLGTNDHEDYALRVVRRVSRRQGKPERTPVPGIVFLEIDGLALPVLQRAIRHGKSCSGCSQT